MYSQNNEEQYILNHFYNGTDPKNGRFLEIGGYHPTVFSNTRALVERGWRGVVCEPSPSCFKSFVTEYGENPEMVLLEYAIGKEDGKTLFFDSNGDAVSTTVVEHRDKWAHNGRVNFSQIEVKTMAMETLLNNYGKDIDFVNIDVESNNIELFNLIPDWFWQRVKLLCIEHDNQYEIMKARLKPFGFQEVALNGENLIIGK